MLPAEWILTLTNLLGCVFYNMYPNRWSLASIITIFKKGNSLLLGNYRGISIINTIAKLYDGVLARRFELFYRPHPNQAGAQEKRGCAEQITTLRLLIDYTRHTKKSLYILFIDFEKAYDKVDRQLLVNMLAKAGCGKVFLTALTRSLSNTMNSIGETIFQSVSGVRQGGPTSCSLFTFYVDIINNSLVQKCRPDGFLKDLHSMMLMDDTAILATSREALIDKMTIVLQCSNEIKMKLHPTKCKYISVGTSAIDREVINLGNIAITHCDAYPYLGVNISNNSIQRQMEADLVNSKKHFHKYTAFLYKNNDAPFHVKKNRSRQCCKICCPVRMRVVADEGLK
jgi:hypothetical protein